MARLLKTVPCWRFYLNYGYGDGWEHECTEFTREEMKENRRAYLQNKPPGSMLKILYGRERVTVTLAREMNLSPDRYEIAPDPTN